MRLKKYNKFVKSKIRQTWADNNGLDPQIVEEVMDEILENYIVFNDLQPEIDVEVRRRMLERDRDSKLKSLLGY